MRHPPFLVFLAGFALSLASCKPPSAAAPAIPADQPIQVPLGAGRDWWKKAYQVPDLVPLDNLGSAEAQLGISWTARGLLLQVTSTDFTPVESRDELVKGDSVQVFISSAYGSDDLLEFIFSAGRTPEQQRVRWRAYRAKNTSPIEIAAPPSIEVTNTDGGYAFEILIPWANFKNPPKAGDVIGLQVFVNDALSPGKVARRAWFPAREANWDPHQMQKVQLGPKAAQAETSAH